MQPDQRPKVSVLHNEAQRRFEAHVGGHVAHTDYDRSGSTITFTHTEVPPELEAQGIGTELVRVALEFAKTHQLTVIPRCAFVRAFIRKNPEYQSLVEAGQTT